MSLSSLLPRRDLVDFIQNQLALISSSTAITCTTAKLAPLRGALQAAVALHAVVIVCAGLHTEQPEEVARMEQYLREISANDSYLRILPEPRAGALRLHRGGSGREWSTALSLNLQRPLPRRSILWILWILRPFLKITRGRRRVIARSLFRPPQTLDHPPLKTITHPPQSSSMSPSCSSANSCGVTITSG